MFEDPYAEYFFPEEVRKMVRNIDWVKSERAKYEAIMPGVNGALVARIRYIDERVSDAVQSGFGQMVIIGAGYDTRAYRIRGLSEKLRVFEVDHPVTQQVKTEVIREIFGDLPAHVAYVPMVFGEDRLDEKLFEAGFDSMQKTLFIAEGLLMYIPPPAVDGLLAFIRKRSAAGSSLVADVFDTTIVDGTSPLKEARMLRKFVDSEGAALQFGIPNGTANAFFKQRGFNSVTKTTPEQCKENYFSAASQNRNVSPMFQFVYAVT